MSAEAKNNRRRTLRKACREELIIKQQAIVNVLKEEYYALEREYEEMDKKDISVRKKAYNNKRKALETYRKANDKLIIMRSYALLTEKRACMKAAREAKKS